MSNSTPGPPPRGLSLYANLLDPAAATPGSVSRGPVVFKTGATETPDDASAKKHQIDAGRFLTHLSQGLGLFDSDCSHDPIVLAWK
jgi:hypothetical protein